MKKPFFTLIIFFGYIQLFALEKHPTGARSLALSNAFVSIPDTWSTFHNQANLTEIEYFTVGIFHESKFMVDELSHTAGSVIIPTGYGVFGASFSQFGKGTFKENKLGLALAKKLAPEISAGIQLDYYSYRFPENINRYGFATFETGIYYTPKPELHLGVHIFNPILNGIKTANGKQKLPTTIRIGGHYQFDETILLTIETQKDNANPFLIKTGIEFTPAQNFALRFGVSGKPVNYTFGLGYSFSKITTDIAFSYHGNLGLTPSISLQFNL